MRKTILVIFAAIVCCLGWNPGGGDGALQPQRAPAEFAAAHGAADVWRCERAYNADLGLPRLCPVEAPAAVTPPQLRNCHTASTQKARLLAASVRRADAVKTTSPNTFFSSFALPQAVDRYVYRLRRLII